MHRSGEVSAADPGISATRLVSIDGCQQRAPLPDHVTFTQRHHVKWQCSDVAADKLFQVIPRRKHLHKSLHKHTGHHIINHNINGL